LFFVQQEKVMYFVCIIFFFLCWPDNRCIWDGWPAAERVPWKWSEENETTLVSAY
jgi:hypothetical protein